MKSDCADFAQSTAETRFLVAEMGANYVGEIANLTSLVRRILRSC